MESIPPRGWTTPCGTDYVRLFGSVTLSVSNSPQSTEGLPLAVGFRYHRFFAPCRPRTSGLRPSNSLGELRTCQSAFTLVRQADTPLSHRSCIRATLGAHISPMEWRSSTRDLRVVTVGPRNKRKRPTKVIHQPKRQRSRLFQIVRACMLISPGASR